MYLYLVQIAISNTEGCCNGVLEIEFLAIFELLGELNVQQGTAFLVVTHDLNLAKRLSRQMEMRDGQLSDHLTLGAI